ncbi:MAG: outer membrane lipoprotein carrier protein LolA [Muribaculaceae bacterium]|nr:outer membrane lipoprotein carrier protein LolA [Muribaculaceae bacterium]
MRYYRQILTTLALLLAVTASAAETAADLLARASSKYSNAKSIVATYTANIGGEPVTGTLTMAGNRFSIVSKPMSVWFDGKTQWTYSAAAREVNITEPTAEEQAQVNPFAILTSFSKKFNVAYEGAATGKLRKIVLTPKTRSGDISRAVITIDTTTLFPTLISITDASRQVTTIKVTRVTPGNGVPASTFTFDKRKYPGVDIVDLR